MARIFYATTEGAWGELELEAPSYWLLAEGAPRVAVGLGRGRRRPGALLHPFDAQAGDGDGTADDASSDGNRPFAGGPGWTLLTRPGARVFRNGEPVALGVAVLRERDELRVDGGSPCYFSDERRVVVEPYAGDDEPRCPRCANPIAADDPSVVCPGCGVRHHQLDERPCWTFVERCALCEQPTALDAGLRWTPEGL